MRVSIVGSGPNGLAAAVMMARAGHVVDVYEANSRIGGGLQSVSFDGHDGILDVCSAVHPMAVSSKFFTEFELEKRLKFFVPEVSYGQALPGRAAIAYRDLDRTVDEMGSAGRAWSRVITPLLSQIEGVRSLSGLAIDLRPSTAVAAVAMGLSAGVGFATLTGAARALAAGVAAHAAAPLSSASARFVAAVLAAEAHAKGWPIPKGGSQEIARAMADDVVAHGGRIHTGVEITDLRSVWSEGDIALLDVGPRGFASMASDLLPTRFKDQLRAYKYGNAVSKADFVLNGPIPWSDERLARAGTVHIGGTARQVSYAEAEARRGVGVTDPFVLVSQPTLFDRSRLAPGSGEEIVWAYAHVPNGSRTDASDKIIAQIERYAPGFKDTIVHSESRPAAWYAGHNVNYVGGDALGGRMGLAQFLTRPTRSFRSWKTPLRGVYLCSAATPPGAGVHGMGGWHAAHDALRDVLRTEVPYLGIDHK